MGNPTRFNNGVTNVGPNDPLAMLPFPSPAKWYRYFTDFTEFFTNAAADDAWVITSTEAGSGSATEVVTDEDGGVLLVTTDDADNDHTFIYQIAETVLYESGKKMAFQARLKVSDATQTDWFVGLNVRDTTPLDTTDAIRFFSDDGDANIDWRIEGSNTETEEAAIATAADDTYMTLTFTYDGRGNWELWKDGVKVSTVADPANTPTSEMTIAFGIQNGEAAAKTLSIDWIFVAKER